MIKHLRRYNKKLDPIYQDSRDITMLSSGSKGNSLIITPYQTIIDLGMAYKHYTKSILKHIKYICLTHEHGDHLNVSTVNQIMKNEPHITFIMRDNLYQIVKQKFKDKNYDLKTSQIRIINPSETIECDLNNNEVLLITAHQTDHGDITNTAYTLKGSVDVDTYESPTLLYASDLIDTNKTKNGQGLPQDEKYDLMFLEANYDHNIILTQLYHYVDSPDIRLNEQQKLNIKQQLLDLKESFDVNKLSQLLETKLYAPKAKGNLRHLSEHQAFRYVNQHLSDHGAFIPLHASSEFGTFDQK